MEDHRRDMVIIFAGYTREMGKFLKVNSELKSRIPNVFDFKDYLSDEIIEISLFGLAQSDYIVEQNDYSDVIKENYTLTNDHSNGRWVRNLNEKLIRHMSARIAKEGGTDLNTITQADLEKKREL